MTDILRTLRRIHTVIINKRTNPCPKCAPFVGKIIIDDVWSGGTAEEAAKIGYLLMSECIKQGLYHPNCKDSHTTYFGDLLDEEEDEQTDITPNDERAFTPEEQALSEQLYEAEQRENYCERQAEKFERLSKYSLDEDNRRVYRVRKSEWKEKLSITDKTVSEIKEKIYLNEEKQVPAKVRNTVQKRSAAAVMIGRGNVADVIQKLSFNTDNSEEKEEKRVANSVGSGIIKTDERFDLHPNKIRKFLLFPGAKHSKEFFDVGYKENDYETLFDDIANGFDITKAVEPRITPGGKESISIFMNLGVNKKRTFRTVWERVPPNGKPRFIIAYRSMPKEG